MTILLSEAAYDAFNPERTGLTTSEAASVVTRIFSTVDYHGDVTAAQILTRYSNTFLPQEMLERIYWLVHPDRMKDLNDNVVNGFRRAMLTDATTPPKEVMPQLTGDEAAMLMALLRRKPYTVQKPQGNAQHIEPDQMAMVFHMYRLGASRTATIQTFVEPLSDFTMRNLQEACRKMYVSNVGWDWRSHEKPPRARRTI